MSILIIDVGSSSVRTLLIDEQLKLIPDTMIRIEYQFQRPINGGSEVDPNWLRHQIETCIDSILRHPHANSIEAVGMTTFVGNLLGVDAKNQPVTPIYTYADTRSASDVAQLNKMIDRDLFYQRTGCVNHTAYHPARLQWLKRTASDKFHQVTQWLDLATYCYRQWFTHAVPCSYSVASWSGLFHHETRTWDEEYLNILELSSDKFPTLADFDTVQQGLATTYQVRWSHLTNIPFYLAIGDGVAANIGSGGINENRPVLTVGTTAAMRITTTNPPQTQAKGLWKYRVDKKRFLIGGATSEGGNIFQWATETFPLSEEAIQGMLQDWQPDAHGLTILPLLAGERSPGFALNAVGTIHGLRLSTSIHDIFLAMLESVALRLGKIADLLKITTDGEIYAGGGAITASPQWAFILANAINRPLLIVDESEVAARGVAYLILENQHPLPEPAIRQRIVPNPEIVEILQQASQRQQKLYLQLYPS